MKRVEWKISPVAFDLLQQAMLRAQMEGHGPTACAVVALTSIGIGPTQWPPEPAETVLIVDPTLDGPIFPFIAQSTEE